MKPLGIIVEMLVLHGVILAAIVPSVLVDGTVHFVGIVRIRSVVCAIAG